MAEKDDQKLPKATVSKLIKEMLPDDVKCANETRDLILECCVEFIHLVSSEANDVCTKDNKKTIAPEHILKALQDLGFSDFVSEVSEVYEKHKVEASEKPKGTRKLEHLGIPTEQLLAQQKSLFEKARSELRRSQEGSDPLRLTSSTGTFPGLTEPKKEN